MFCGSILVPSFDRRFRLLCVSDVTDKVRYCITFSLLVP